MENVSNMFELDYKVEHAFKPIICNEGIKDIIKSVSQDLDLKHIEMPSRASHDVRTSHFVPWE